MKIVASITLLFFSLWSISAQEQAGTKVLTIPDNPYLEAPLSLEVYLYGKKIQSDKPFKADDNWIEDLQIVVTNKSDDDITFVSLVLDFPTEHNGEPMVKRFKINYGRDNGFIGDEDPDVETRRIGKREIAVITFNSNNHQSSEQFRELKKSSAYSPETWDRGVLAVGAVEFEDHAWYMGFDFDKKDGKWEKNAEKERKLIERIKKFKQKEAESKIGLLRKPFLPARKAYSTCYTVGSPVGAEFFCTLAAQCQTSGCKYFKPNVIIADIGLQRVKSSPACTKASNFCGCCEPDVWDLATSQPACSSE